MSQLQNHIRHFAGSELITEAAGLQFETLSARCILQGKAGDQQALTIPLTDELFSKHLLFLGNIGTGKTNAISQVIAQIKNQMTTDDLMIIFDTKGDFYKRFYKPGDIVISNKSAKFEGATRYWNIFSEINLDGSIEENALEISSSLFADKIKRSNAPFFPQAAKDIFSTLLTIIATEMGVELQNNDELITYLEATTKADLQEFFTSYDQPRLNSYLSQDAAAQADGILAEMHQLLKEIFVGDFKKAGDLSVRNLVREKGGKTIFLEYDIAAGNVLTPIYRLLFDLCIKETLSSASKGNVWFMIDEFSLLPNLKYLDNGINFGRSQGAKFIIGVQNIPQVYNEYGEHLGQSILSGVRTVFSFHVDDLKSREFIQNRYGYAQKKLTYTDAFGKSVVNVSAMKVIEDWHISGLSTGTAIIGLPEGNPFLFSFCMF